MAFLGFSPTFIGLLRIDFLQREVIRRDPPVCFSTVFGIVSLIACLGAFLLPTISRISGNFVSGALFRYV